MPEETSESFSRSIVRLRLRFICLQLTVALCKGHGKGQGRAHFRFGYLVNGDRLSNHLNRYMLFRVAYLHLTLAHSSDRDRTFRLRIGYLDDCDRYGTHYYCWKTRAIIFFCCRHINT